MTQEIEKKGAATVAADETKPEEGKGLLRTKEAEHAGAKSELAKLRKELSDENARAAAEVASLKDAHGKMIAFLNADIVTLERQRNTAWEDREKAFADGYGLKQAELEDAAKKVADAKAETAELREKNNAIRAAYFKLESRLKRAEDALSGAIEKPRWMFWGNPGIQLGDGPED